MNKLLTGHEKVMYKSLRSHKQVMNISWTSYEKSNKQVIYKSWTNYEQGMNKS